jgi:hypothetical protein
MFGILFLAKQKSRANFTFFGCFLDVRNVCSGEYSRLLPFVSTEAEWIADRQELDSVREESHSLK